MATRTIANAGGNWSATATWVEAAVPTSADDVVATATSGNLTLDVTGSCRSFDMTGYVNTFAMGVNTLNVGDAVGGNFKLVAGMTLTVGGLYKFNFVSTTTGNTVDFANKSFTNTGGNIIFAGNGGGWTLANGWTQNTGSVVSVTGLLCTLNLNNQTITTGAFNPQNSANVTFGTGTINIGSASQGNGFSNTSTGTMSCASGTINITGAGSFLGNGKTYGTLSFTGASTAGALNRLTGANTFTTLTRTGTAITTDGLQVEANQTITGTLTLTGNSTTNRLIVQTNSAGTPFTLTAAAVSITNTDFMDITGAGAAAPFTGTSLGNCLGNSNITFDSPVTQTWSGNTTGSYSTAANWTSRVPLPQDPIIINGLTSGTITFNMPRVGAGVDFTGSTAGHVTLTINFSVYGSWTYVSTLVVTGNFQFTFAGRGSHTLTSAGIGPATSSVVAAPGGTYTLQDNFKFQNAAAGINFLSGTFDANGYNVLTTGVNSFPGNVNMGSGTWTLSGNGVIWQSPTGTLNTQASTIIISDTSATTKTFRGNGKVYNNLQINGAVGAAAVIVTGANTFSRITGQANAHLTLPSSTTTTISSLVSLGTAGNLFVLDASTTGTAATIAFTTSGLLLTTLKNIAAAVSFVGSISRAIAKGLTAGLTPTASLAKTLNRTLPAASLGFVGGLKRTTNKVLSGGLSFSGAIAKIIHYARTLTAGLSFTGSISRQTAHKLTAAGLSFTGGFNRTFAKALSAALSFSGSFARQTRKVLTASLSLSGTLAQGRAYLRSLTAGLSFSGSLNPAQLFWTRIKTTIFGSGTAVADTSGGKVETVAGGARIETVSSGTKTDAIQSGSKNINITSGDTKDTL